MAQLPSAESLGERPVPVLPRRTPMIAYYRPTTGLEDFGSQELARGAGEMESAAVLALNAKQQQDTLRAEDAFTQLRQAQIGLTFGQNGFALLRGGAAVNAPILKTYGAQFDQAAANIAGGLDNDNQRQLFQQRANVAGLQFREDIVRHIAQQNDVYAGDVFRSKLDTEEQAAAARWATPDAASVPLLNIDNAIHDFATRYGKPQEWVDATRQNARSKVYGAIIRQGLSSVGAEGARKLFDAYSPELLASDRAQLDATIESRSYTEMMRQEIAESRAERRAEHNLRLAQTANESALLADTLSGKPPDTGTLSTMLRQQRISPGGMAGILALERRGEDLPDNTPAALDLYKNYAQGTLKPDDVMAAASNGQIKASTAKSLLVGIANRGARSDSAEARGYFSTLRTVFQGQGIDQGFIKDPDAAARWAGVQKAWTEDVDVKGMSVRDAFNDVAARFQPPGHPPVTWEQPRFGAIIDAGDITGVSLKTQAAFDSGQLSQAALDDQKRVIFQYKRFFDQQAAAAAALRATRATQGTAQPKPISPSSAPATAVVPTRSESLFLTPQGY